MSLDREERRLRFECEILGIGILVEIGEGLEKEKAVFLALSPELLRVESDDSSRSLTKSKA